MAEAATREHFAAFVRDNWSTLMSIGLAVTASRAEAEDLVQTALTNAYGRWHRIRSDHALAYVRRSILNAHVSRWRQHGRAELVVAAPPEAAVWDTAVRSVDDRLTLLPLLRCLPPKQRAVLVLRYLCDLPDADVARTLGISVGTVRSQASRALATLRAQSAPSPPAGVLITSSPSAPREDPT